MSGVLEGLKALGIARLVAMGGVAAGVLGLLLVLMLRGGGSHTGLLYGDLDLKEAAQIAAVLDKQHIPHSSGPAGTDIIVPVEQIANARMLLAREGLPSGGSIGYEIFDRGGDLLDGEFMQRINQTRALEGELARSIETIHGVRAARVHVVLPHREPFARTPGEAQASILLTLTGPQRLDAEEVQAILNLVAAAVPGLKPENISVIDSRGRLLARAGTPSEPMAEAATLDELRHATEMRLARAVEEMLERSLGPGRVQAEAAVEMDMSQVRETRESYDPDGQVVRSTQTVTDSNHSTDSAQTTSVQNNLPNAPTSADGAGSSEQRQEETTNYEIGKTVRSIVDEQPQIKRISLAVLVDGVEARDAKGVPQWQPRPQTELDRITALVRSAIGFDEKRGDHIEVASMRFVRPDEAEAGPAPLLGVKLEKSDLMRLAQTALIGVLGIAALLLVLRPTVLRLTRLPGSAASADAALGYTGEGALAAGAGATLAYTAGGAPRLLAPDGGGRGEIADETMVDVANVEGQMRASLIRRVAALVEQHPTESLVIVRGWMSEEAA